MRPLDAIRYNTAVMSCCLVAGRVLTSRVTMDWSECDKDDTRWDFDARGYV